MFGYNRHRAAGAHKLLGSLSTWDPHGGVSANTPLTFTVSLNDLYLQKYS